MAESTGEGIEPIVFRFSHVVAEDTPKGIGVKMFKSESMRDCLERYYWDNGMRVISANKTIEAPDDLKGLTIRVEPSHVFQLQYSKLGAVAISMPFKRIPDALKSGIVIQFTQSLYSTVQTLISKNIIQKSYHSIALKH